MTLIMLNQTAYRMFLFESCTNTGIWDNTIGRSGNAGMWTGVILYHILLEAMKYLRKHPVTLSYNIVINDLIGQKYNVTLYSSNEKDHILWKDF